MKKIKWIVGLSIASLIVLSGTAFALNSRSVVTQSTGQVQGLEPNTASSQYQGNSGDINANNNVPTNSSETGQLIKPNLSSPSNNIAQGPNGYSGSSGFMGGNGTSGARGSYGTMGGYGANESSGGYGMMGGYGTNGPSGGYGMMGGYGANGAGRGYSMMGN